MSCTSAGNCTAGGYCTDAYGQQAFVISEVNGTWGTAQETAGHLNVTGGGGVASVASDYVLHRNVHRCQPPG
jgi:hypothetical protein